MADGMPNMRGEQGMRPYGKNIAHCHDSRECRFKSVYHANQCKILIETYADGECPFWKEVVKNEADGNRRK